MKFSRRTMIIGGGAVVIVAGAGIAAGAFALTRTPAAALAPWESAKANSYADPRLRALTYAILAPNPHNRQPWLVELVGEDSLIVHVDRERRLPETDPFDRQITVGVGCFLELLRLAAAVDGFIAKIEPFPEGEPTPRLDARPLAAIRFAPASVKAEEMLFRQVLNRHTNRKPFDLNRPVPVEALEALRASALAPDLVGSSNVAEKVAALRALTWRALELEFRTPRTFHESTRLLRIGRSEIEANPDGIAIDGFFPDLMTTLGLFDRADLEKADEATIADTLERFRPAMASSMAFIWLLSRGNSRIEQLAAGRDWLRIHLAATELGLALQPVSQALQEFPEMGETFTEVHATLGAAGEMRVQMLGRLGYGPPVGPSPRWPLDTRIRRT